MSGHASTISREIKELLDADSFEAALELLYTRHREDVRRFVRFRRPLDPVEDVCQDVWLAVRRALPSFRSDATPRAWLLSIAGRKVADSYRRNRQRQNDVEFDSSAILLSQLPLGPRRPSSPFTKLERQERLALLEAAFRGWDPMDREILELRFITDLKPAAIVEILDLDTTPNAVSQRLVRLIRRLRDHLSRHDAFAPPAKH